MAVAPYVKAKTCVWWDIENCQVPISCDPYSIAQNISKSLADMNYKGMVTISAYGDTRKINSSSQQALSSTGIALNHVPAGIKDASDKKILVDMLMWGYDNPPPANHLLISGDPDFSNALHQLSMRRYNVLLAQPEKISQALVSAAKTVWLWSSLVEGGRPSKQIPNVHNTMTNIRLNTEKERNNILCSSHLDDINQKNNNNGILSKTQSQQGISTSSKGNAEGDKQSIGSFVLTTTELDSDCITSNTNPTPCIPKPQQLVDSDKSQAPCGPTSNYTPKTKQKKVKRIPSNTTTSTADGSGVQESTIDDMAKINNSSTLSQPSPLVLETSKSYIQPCSPLVLETSKSYIQPCPDMASSNHKNELTQPSHAHEAQGGNTNNTSSSFSTKPSSQILRESNSPNAPKSNPNTMLMNDGNNSNVEFLTKKNKKKLSKQPQNQYSQSCLHSTDLSGSNYNDSSTSSPVPTIRPDDYQSVPSTMPDVSPSTPIPDISTSSCNGNEEGNEQLIESSDSSIINQKNDLKHPNHSLVLTTPELGCIPNLLSAAKAVWLWTSLVVGGRPVEKIPNLHDTFTNSISNNETQTNSILCLSQPHDFNRKNNNNGNFDNQSKAKQISKTQSQPIMSMLSSNGVEEGSKKSIGSSDSSNPNQKNDLKHPNHTFVLTTTEGLGSNCITSNTNPTSNHTPKIKKNKVKRIPSDTTTSTIDGSGAQGSTINDMIKINNTSTFSRPSPLVVPESGKSLSIGPTLANIQPSPDIASSKHENELTQHSHAHEAKGGGNISKTSSSSSTKSSSEVLPESNYITSNMNPTPCVPESQKLVDSGKFNTPCVPTSSYSPKIKKKKVKKIPSNTTTSITDGSEVQESTANGMIKINSSSTLSCSLPLVVSESSKCLSIDSTFSNIQPSSDMASTNHENELTQPSHAHEAKSGGNIRKTFCSFSTKSSSEVLPESNYITSNANPTPCIPESQQLANSGKFNAPFVPTSNYSPKINKKKVKKIPSNTTTSITDGSEEQESTANDMIKINSSSTLSRSLPLVVSESSKCLSIDPTFANIQPSPYMASSNHENELTQPSHAHEAKSGGNIRKTSCSFSTKSSSEVLPESNYITSNANPTPCIPESQQLVDSGKFNAPCAPTSIYSSKIKKKKVKRIPSDTNTSTTYGSGAQEITINDVLKINNSSTSSRPSPLVVPESSKSLSTVLEL